jgi:hypothetical protein
VALRPYLPPDHGYFDMAQVFVSWAQREHRRWFNGERRFPLMPWENPDDYPPQAAYAHSEGDDDN